MTVTVLGGALLVVAIVSLAVYVLALERLLTRPARPGLVRTAVCRVGAAVLYVVVGFSAATSYRYAPEIALATFMVVQIVWQSNAVADVRLTRRPRNGATRPRQWPSSDISEMRGEGRRDHCARVGSAAFRGGARRWW